MAGKHRRPARWLKVMAALMAAVASISRSLPRSRNTTQEGAPTQ